VTVGDLLGCRPHPREVTVELDAIGSRGDWPADESDPDGSWALNILENLSCEMAQAHVPPGGWCDAQACSRGRRAEKVQPVSVVSRQHGIQTAESLG